MNFIRKYLVGHLNRRTKFLVRLIVLIIIISYLPIFSGQVVRKLFTAASISTFLPLLIFSQINYSMGKDRKVEKQLIALYLLAAVGIISPILLYADFYKTFFEAVSQSVYFSSITYTGLGLGNLPPYDSELLKLAVMSESLLGYFNFGLIIVFAAKIFGSSNQGKLKEQGKKESETITVEKDLSSQPPKRKP